MRVLILCGVLTVVIQLAHGGTLLAHLVPKSHNRIARSPQSSSTINESQLTTGGTYGFVNSTAEGNGEPGSAVAYAWQGGQSSAQSQQTATADKNSNAQTTGFSTCQQGYSGTAGGKNSTAANSVGQALCNATYTQQGTHETSSGASEGTKGFGGFQFPLGPPQMIIMNYTAGQVGEAVSGQTHNSNSNINVGHMNIFAGGFANTPQGGMTFQHSALDPFGQPIAANQSHLTDQGLNSEEHTYIATGGANVGHNSGGLAHVFGLGNQFNSSYNSHAEEEDEEEKKKAKVVSVAL